MDIETKHASLDTLAVTILALHVNGKQMTLAVFRQLARQTDIDGLAWWGTVRYPMKDDADVWGVGEVGGRLVRVPVFGCDENRVTRYRADIALLEEIHARGNEKIEWYSENYKTMGERYGGRMVDSAMADARDSLRYVERCVAISHAVSGLPQLFIAV